MDDRKFLQLAIEQSQLSVSKEKFPAGALIVREGVILSSGTSDVYPGYQHAECRAIDTAFEKHGILSDTTLYASMEPCLMCLTRAYWSGIRRIVYGISSTHLNRQYYEGKSNGAKMLEDFNESVEYLKISELENDALEVVRIWEKHQKPIGKT